MLSDRSGSFSDHPRSFTDRCQEPIGIVVDHCGSLWVVVGRCGSFRVLVTTGDLNDYLLFMAKSGCHLRWPNSVFARAFAHAIQHVHKDFKKQTCRQ